MNCAGCGKSISKKALNTTYVGTYGPVAGVYTCNHCGAILGSCYKGDSYGVVGRRFDTVENCDTCEPVYYDLEVLGSDGINRIHGWMNPTTRLIVQVG